MPITHINNDRIAKYCSIFYLISIILIIPMEGVIKIKYNHLFIVSDSTVYYVRTNRRPQLPSKGLSVKLVFKYTDKEHF